MTICKTSMQYWPRKQRLNPGPIVTATAERLSSDKFALSSACWTTCKNKVEVICWEQLT